MRHRGNRYSLPTFSFVVSLAIILVTVIVPDPTAYAVSAASEPASLSATQQFEHASDHASPVLRDNYRITMKSTKPTAPTAPAVGKPDAGTAKAIAYDLVLSRGWGEGEYRCLVALWTRESNWNTFAMNPTSGAYGIPQALPGKKMAAVGADWATNPETQIRWGLGYVAGRYGTPCRAWNHLEQRNWY